MKEYDILDDKDTLNFIDEKTIKKLKADEKLELMEKEWKKEREEDLENILNKKVRLKVKDLLIIRDKQYELIKVLDDFHDELMKALDNYEYDWISRILDRHLEDWQQDFLLEVSKDEITKE